MQSLSVIIPAYNEEKNILTGRLAEVVAWLETYPAPSELIVVDDGSTDATARLAGSVAERLIAIPHSGKATALMTGMMAAVHDLILFTDMDLATPIAEATRLLTALDKSADIAIGSRGLLRRHAPLGRYILSLGHIILRRLILRLSLIDTQCGFKACKRQVALEILNRLNVYRPGVMKTVIGPRVNSGFDTEFIFTAFHLGYKIVEVPVQWNYKRARRAILFMESYWGLRDLIYIAREYLKGKYSRSQRSD
jgi:dolichyl-phosphate beta-glucosyltransferase